MGGKPVFQCLPVSIFFITVTDRFHFFFQKSRQCLRFHTRLLWRLSTLLQPHKLSCCGEVWRPPHPAAHMAARAHRDTHVGGRELHGWPDVGTPTGPPGPAGPCLLQIAIGMAKSNGSCQPDQSMLWKTHTNALGWHALQPQNSKFGIATVRPDSKIGTKFQGLSTLSHRVWQSWCGECCGELHTFSPPVASVLWRIQAKVWKMCLWCGISNTECGVSNLR